MKSIHQELEHFRSVITYEATLGRTSLTVFRVSFFILFIVCTLSLIISAHYNNGSYDRALLGSALVFFALWLEQILLYCFHNSFYYRGFDSFIGSAHKSSQGITHEVAQILLRNEGDITSGFCLSPLGAEVLVRCNISARDIKSYLSSNRIFIPAVNLTLSPQSSTTVYDVATFLYTHDQSFVTLLTEHGVQHDTFFGALQFVLNRYISAKRRTRWWSRDQLSLHRGIGRSLSTGTAQELDRFSQSLSLNHDSDRRFTPEEIQQIQNMERMLATDKASNIMVIAEDESRALAILTALASRVVRGSGLNALSGLSFRILSIEKIISAHPDTNSLETALHHMLTQAGEAATQVIIIPRLRDAINACLAYDVSLPTILETYLAHPTIHCIGIDSANNYHAGLQPHTTMMRRFQQIILEGTTLGDTINILQPIVARQESRRGVLFTYDAIVAAVEGAERYIPQGLMPEKAIDLIHDIAQSAQQQGVVCITIPFVQTFLSQATGIPLGPITTQERDQLLHLEQILSMRVVGQPEAVKAIARTLRRARVDIERTDKPMGSFLFLGPTGVGKTETAKALAHIFFGDEQKMVRFDMSEFSGAHTLGYLTGDENGTGMLTDKLQEHPYCLILLDEFEKAHSSVHDLFLQILDEGYFTSTQGIKVNARNTLIIATSNAASDLIAKTSHIRTNAPHLEADVLNHIIENGIFKPELLNRFDSTVIFEPLPKEALTQVAQLLVNDVSTRVLTRGYHLTTTPELIALIVEKSFTERSGGRGLNHGIQDLIEEKIAQIIIEGKTPVGGHIHLSVEDFSPVELSLS